MVPSAGKRSQIHRANTEQAGRNGDCPYLLRAFAVSRLDEEPQEYKEFSARVMRFVSGQTLDSLDKQHLTPKLLFEVGAYIGRVDTALQVWYI